MKKSGKGYSAKIGNKPDGARKSKKVQVTALLPQNKMEKSSRQKRMAKMEAKDAPV